ncbi:MAG: cytochrome c maturation protein CcmE [Pseudomonadota bacterium]|nr:cytochrome c maturation protein CcmE [Pseudomonadota bacterium]MEC8877223.1 cytochrome c maturation protein CcmE [Pseudomonadota bacterium]MED5339529.1 cytochrome c maturation protein CcmE [Pseudomonadota bacterium]MEE3207032.1 cytochrome c maturation protein CcmE [Pseudomonadota bacterium]MEE3261048.1 cytochrome c maturation protein CcmE [Pseudomonadota bacterium]|tara:strand:- start:604 stop:1023 length:420 start_codon:yes stop_codon:yes gene_type:complete
MNQINRRFIKVLVSITFLSIAIGLILIALQDNLVFFHSPSEVKEKKFLSTQRIRVGGLVIKNSVNFSPSKAVVSFQITDLNENLQIIYQGILPDLFREEQGIIAEGYLISEDSFEADQVLAKHDENYMPPEIAETLKGK